MVDQMETAERLGPGADISSDRIATVSLDISVFVLSMGSKHAHDIA